MKEGQSHLPGRTGGDYIEAIDIMVVLGKY